MYNQRIIRLILAITFLLWSHGSFAISVSQLGGSLNASGLVTELIDTSNSEITISGVKYQGAYQAAGTFSEGMIDGLGIESGVILTTGKILNAIGPNACYKTTTVNRRPGDNSLNTLSQGTSYDAAVLEFDFIAQGDTLKFEYVFASEEYPEWVGSKFNDIFAFFLDDENIAIVPKSSTPVAINTINKWSNSQYYNDNEYPSPSNVTDYNKNNCQPGSYTPFLTEFDGFTTVLSAVAKVTPGKKHHLKLAIADRGDFSLDSAVFIKGKSFTLVLPPPATTLISPSEIIYTNTPTFSWHEVSSATIYELQLVDANNNVLVDNKYFSDEIACDSQAGSCSVTPGTALADGTYQWQVKTQNQAGGDLWSNTLSFTVKTLPDPATLIAPLENIIKCDLLPTYQWQPAALATRYLLHVKDAQGQIFDQWYNANEVNCINETAVCSVTPTFQPAEGSVQWQIKTANAKGEGPWSPTGSFTMKCPPPATTLVQSSSTTGSTLLPGIGGAQSAVPLPVNNPTSYSWNAVPDTTLYQLQIQNQAGEVVVKKWYSATNLNCNQEQVVCSVNLEVDLPDGNYQWQIQPRNEVGPGPWSQSLPMTIKKRPDAAILISPTAALLNCNQKPTYSWQVAYLATQYLLSVQDVLGVTTERWYSNTEANCTTTTCSVTPDFPVVEGNVQWRVKTANSEGEGPWSAPFVFTVKCPPPPTTLSEVTPVTNSNLIAYNWKAVPSATLYQLQVKNSQGQVILKKWYSATSLNCNSGQENCLTNLGLNLSDGTYYSNVQTRNEVGYGAWSNTLPLVIKTLPDAATLVSPTATLLNCTQIPTYSWKPANLATQYLLSVQDTSKLTEQWYSMTAANCTDTVCSVTPNFNVVEGNVSWRVKTANAKGEGPWSESWSFAVKCPPPATTLVSPTGVINDNTPTYTWNTVVAATTYRLQVFDANNQIVVDEPEINCNVNQDVCSITPNPKLLEGNYSWKVQTQNQVGPGAWSEPMLMTIKVIPDATTLISPTQTFVNCNQLPTYSWKPTDLATQYLLSVQDSQKLTEQWYSTTQANCDSTTCLVTPDFKPVEGYVSWRIKAANSEGEAPWSEALSFTMKCPPAATTLVTSSSSALPGNPLFPLVGTGASLLGLPAVQNSPSTYKWQAVPGATHYQLQIKDAQGQVVMETGYPAASLNCSSLGQTICSVNVNNLNLPDGNYQWQVQVSNEVSSGPWSNPNSFTVKVLPDATSLISPTQTLVNCNQIPTYSWQPVALATRYLLSVQDSLGITEHWYSDAEANCTNTTCSIIPDFQLAGGDVQWRIKAANLNGEGPWSETLSFVVQCPPIATTLISPSGIISDNMPAYTWHTVPTATTYQLQVTDADNQIVVEETISNCNSDQEICVFNSTTPLVDSHYSWNIQTQNQVGNGQWSQALSFTVLTTPLAATLVSPQVTLHHNLPTYTWQTVPKATQYLMRVQDASGQVFEKSYTSAAANCSEETHLCAVTPDKELAEGEAQWWIQTANSSGSGPLSAAMSFTVEKVTTCKLYAVDDEGLNDSQFLIIDPQSATINALGALYVDHDIEALDASLETEQLYAASGKDALLPGVLYTVDSSTGQLNVLGDLGLADVSGLSINPMTGQLWGWSPGNGLFWVDVAQLPLLPQFEWLSTMRIDDLTWNEEGTMLYLAQRNKLLRYEGNKAKPTLICTLPEERKIEALEITPGNVLLMGIDGKDIVYTVNVDSDKNCVIEPFDTLETPYQDIEGMTLGCSRHYVVE